METRTKWVTALMIALIAVGALTIVPGILADSEQAGENRTASKDIQALKKWIVNNLRRPGLGLYILKNGTPATLVGTAEVQTGNIVVMDTDNGQINVVVPGKWVVDGQVLTVADLFDGTPFTLGESELSVDTLMVELKTETHTVSAYFAYKIVLGETTANALLPFNISVP